jgi:peptidoglycan/LPS O-acetylase OafA/YrhL
VSTATAKIPVRISQVGKGRNAADSRILALDFTKGALVLVMVLYHWLNYFIGTQGDFYRYLSFLPPSFICITGFLVSHVYVSKQKSGKARLPGRLAIRGLKIILIFVFLNAAISFLVPRSYGGSRMFDNLTTNTLLSVFVTGNMAGGRLAAFYILVPIGYLLLLASFCLSVYKYYRLVFHTVVCAAVLSNLILHLYGIKSLNVDLFSVGLIGIALGYLPIDIINKLLLYPVAVIVLYCTYVVAITEWNIRYPLQIAGVMISLAALYLLGTSAGSTGKLQRTLILVGQYSLWGYIAQIAILQVLRRALAPYQSPAMLMLVFVGATAMTILSVIVVNRARAGSQVVDGLYRAIFA